MTNAQLLLDTLAEAGVEYVFCCPGTTEIPVLDELVDRSAEATPKFILTTDEAVAVSMADGYSRVTGKPGVAYLHTNVGLANGIAHTYAAQTARSSVVILVGIKPTQTIRNRALTTTPRILESVEPYSVHTWQNLHPDDLAADILEALRRSQVTPGGVAVLTIPQNHVEAAAASGAKSVTYLAEPVKFVPNPDALKRAAEETTSAQKVLIVAGSDVAKRGATQELLQLAERLNAPVAIESRRDLERWPVPSTDPYFAGMFDAHGKIADEADLVILAGLPTPIEFGPGVPVLPRKAKILHLSEDPSEIGRRERPAVGLTGDTRISLELLLDAVNNKDFEPGPESIAYLKTAKQIYKLNRETREGGAGGAAMRVLAEALGGHGVLVLDAVTSTLPLLTALERDEADTLHATASGSLGWGLGGALGIALGLNKRVICVIGDGVLQFGLPSLWSAVNENLPVTFVVVNNGKYQAVISGLKRFDGQANATGNFPLTDISGVNAAALAEAFGMPGIIVENGAELQREIVREKELTAHSGPRLLDIRVNDQNWPEA